MTDKDYFYTWEEAISILRKDTKHQKLIFDAYLTEDLLTNATRFLNSEELSETIKLIHRYHENPKDILDIAAGNGIATFAFAKRGFNVTAVEPDDSLTLGRKAIKSVLKQGKLAAKIENSYGEDLPFPDSSFDIVYIRQGLHHANDLKLMLKEIHRVLRPDGVFIACRDHVINNRKESLKSFLSKQVDHQLYGGENAFTLKEYITSITATGFLIKLKLGPYETPINLYPMTYENILKRIKVSTLGKIVSLILPSSLIISLVFTSLKLSRRSGRLYSFVATKN